ncbi:MAG: hypothetical protein WKG03_16585 [Telluria sp.]
MRIAFTHTSLSWSSGAMHDAILKRQVALVSYGNQFLSGQLTLDDFFRHGIFFGHRLQFRASAENALLADDFTLWLGVLRETGARRLSLHRARDVTATAERALRGGDFVVVVHFGDRCQLWACGEEQAIWWRHPHVPKGGYQHSSACPPAAAYGGDIDSYWCVAEVAGELAVPQTHWKQLAATIDADVQLSVAAADKQPFIVDVHDAPDWAIFPLFPYASADPVAHQLMTVLTDAQATFANDTHCKNDSSPFHQLSEAEATEKIHWGQRLDQWTMDLHLRCANALPTVAPAAKQEPDALVDVIEPASEAPVAPRSTWTQVSVFALLLVLISLLLLGASHIVTTHAWLSVVIGLPLAAYVCWPSKKA